MSRVTISQFIQKSRIISKNFGLYSVNSTQTSDIIIYKKNSSNYFITYLPTDYHIKNPQYLQQKLDGVLRQAKQGRIVIIVLNEHGASGKTIGQIQSLCLKKNVNMIICFDIEQVKELINDISLL